MRERNIPTTGKLEARALKALTGSGRELTALSVLAHWLYQEVPRRTFCASAVSLYTKWSLDPV